ncbi:hypothetical protein [Aurantiacibacter gangjinensis]|uniref:Uncharacterized protein n=1 Tax=Aurantiacibacter gangjinensis TaxID=502682 RepID=A0A0G9MKF9_9SPHN|nr:hypothetical protein [Aurantiacibacter gangjinensis]APE29455.1 hypothetical protein BMF35_b0200 [Aurantiacibacter gangjinensis]KLE31165.1 hypothetical protein AAW01_13145 [Aurantiacibacter gangjinensis]
MRIALSLAAALMLSVPAHAQDDTRFIFTFDGDVDWPTNTARLAETAHQRAEDIVDPAYVICSGGSGETARERRREVRSALALAGAAPFRILDAGVCDAQITGRSRRAIGENNVWLGLAPYQQVVEFVNRRLGGS